MRKDGGREGNGGGKTEVQKFIDTGYVGVYFGR